MNELDQYGLILFFKTYENGLPLAEQYLRYEEYFQGIKDLVVQNLVEFGADRKLNTNEIANAIMELLIEGNCFTEIKDGVAGLYIKYASPKYRELRQKILQNSQIFKYSNAIGQRYFKDVFDKIDIIQFDDGSYTALSAPASDRVVTFSHNQIVDFDQTVSELVEEVERDNGCADEIGLRERILGQLKAGRELIRSGQVRAYLLYEVLVRALGEIIEKYGNPTIKSLANALLGAIVSQILEGQ